MISISPLSATVAHGGNTLQFSSSEPFIAWSVDAAGSGSSIDETGLFTSGPNAGTALVRCQRFCGAYGEAAVTVT